MLVPGAIAAMSAARTMKQPAEAARAPRGPTNTITGTRAFISFWIISRMEESRPPGVSSSRTNAAAFCASASAIPRVMYSALAGPIGPAYEITTTSDDEAGSAAIGIAQNSRAQTVAAPERKGFMRRTLNFGGSITEKTCRHGFRRGAQRQVNFPIASALRLHSAGG